MRICFVLPQMIKKCVGGYKMVYEYANRLAEEGHFVGILFLNDNALNRFNLPGFLRVPVVGLFTRIEPRWFELSKKVKKYSSIDRNVLKKIGRVDLAIATGVDTVEAVCNIFADSHKAYFIQGYENWVYSEDVVNKTFAMGMDNIVISSWLKEVVDKYGKEPALLLKNPINTKIYRVINSVEKREKFTIGILYHQSENKGFDYAYKALIKVKEIFPEIKVKIFGTSRPTNELPEWFEFKLNASQQETVDIYNSVSIFLCATISEGFGLTGLEAMACGATLVSTCYEGVKEYAISEVNSMLSPVKDVEGLVHNMKELIMNNEKRIRLAIAGVETAQSFSWENAMNVLTNYLDTVSLE